jgi:hypothetical protein
MVRVVINDNQGLVQRTGTGCQIANATQLGSAVYTAGTATAAVATTGPELTGQLVELVTSDGNTKRVSLPLAAGAGQMVWVVETAGTNSVVVRNQANDATLATITANLMCLFVSTASGDNWKSAASI